MRILKWLLAAAATATAGAYLSDRVGSRRTAARFLAALRRGEVEVHAESTSIPDPGIRQESFHGTADGTEFLFTARTDRDAARWTFTLAWTGGPVIVRWNAVSDRGGYGLSGAYATLKKLPVRPRDAKR